MSTSVEGKRGAVRSTARRVQAWRAPVALCALALVMGAPTLRGGFVGGDDHRLVLDHVLVSRPSLSHALKLFTIVHRDLYQPLPLLSFSLEFALTDALAWRADRTGLGGGAWVFHLTNAVLHAVVTLCVWCLLRRIQPRGAVAIVGAALFALHPLQVEVVAWVNGRMMLLSTLFAVGSLIALTGYIVRPRARTAALVLVLLALCMISKVRPALPFLMVIVAAAVGVRRPDRRLLVPWGACVAVTAGFVWLNLSATAGSEMFLKSSERMTGPTLARVAITLAWYLTHWVWPAGLAAWYEPPPVVAWMDARTLRAVGVLLAVGAATAWSARRTRVAWLGLGWFLVSIASTLPIVPSRYLLAADRYMYLPVIGVCWITAALLVAAYDRVAMGTRRAAARIAFWILGVAVAGALLGVSWRTSAYYTDSVAKMTRNLQIHPNSPNMHAKLGWAWLQRGDVDRALALAREELALHADRTADEAYQLMGAAYLKRKAFDAAIDAYRRAVDAAPDNKQAQYRLASALAQAGRNDEALEAFRRVIPQLPRFNPGMIRAANLYRSMGYLDDARELYERVLANNPYDIFAPVALAEMDMTRGRYDLAATRLEKLLAWMPEHAAAGINLGVCYARLGRPRDAIQAYQRVLRFDPTAVQALLNLAWLRGAEGSTREAADLLERAATAGGGDLDVLIAAHEFWIDQGNPARAVAMWKRWSAREPSNTDRRAWLAWAQAINGATEDARRTLATLPADVSAMPLVAAAGIVWRLRDADPTGLVAPVDAVCAGTDAVARGLREHLRNAVLWIGRRDPRSPWPYYVAGRLFAADGQTENARAGLRAFLDICDQPDWRARAQRQLDALQKTQAPNP